jgi:hypothetical protein
MIDSINPQIKPVGTFFHASVRLDGSPFKRDGYIGFLETEHAKDHLVISMLGWSPTVIRLPGYSEKAKAVGSLLPTSGFQPFEHLLANAQMSVLGNKNHLAKIEESLWNDTKISQRFADLTEQFRFCREQRANGNADRVMTK